MLFLIINILNIGVTIYLIGIWGILVLRSNLLIILMSIELILFSISLLLTGYGAYIDDITGQIFSFFILVVAACESSIGLAILVSYYRLVGVIDLNKINVLKG